MNIKELKERIKDLPDNMDVMIEQEDFDYRYGMSNEAIVEPILFSDPFIKKSEWVTIDCLIIRD